MLAWRTRYNVSKLMTMYTPASSKGFGQGKARCPQCEGASHDRTFRCAAFPAVLILVVPGETDERPLVGQVDPMHKVPCQKAHIIAVICTLHMLSEICQHSRGKSPSLLHLLLHGMIPS